ncbi:hypothetical protein C1I95_11230 [Micromonospora craterilacus]|uniref:Uncharacterized protein n=1 Tax=Micromonospora craterilacus TaxID=1655439 RepID=A0A2W2F3U6_9ACTN|nr:hypothetical protein [Micromonospora craterilacus]PZG19678.1 hypothetical protein C1I95_11230 [Micromonospora craterilacus]
MSPAKGGQPVSELIVESVGQTLALMSDRNERASVLAVAVSLPAEAGRRAVLTSPMVTARPDLFELLLKVLTEHLAGVAAGVRLVPLGSYAESIDIGPETRWLSGRIGQDVAFPLVELSLTANFLLTPAAWAVSAPDTNLRNDPSWPAPLPPPPPPLALPSPAPPKGDTPSATERRIAASIWPHLHFLPNGASVDRPKRRPPRVWLPPRPDSARGTRAGSSAAAVEVPAGVPGIRTAAGWSFADGPVLGNGPVLAGFLVEIVVDVAGFRVDGRPVAPSGLARLITSCRLGDPRPLVIVPHGVLVQGSAADVLFGGLADVLEVPVHVAYGTVSRTATGLLQAAGTFRRWLPRTPGRPPAQDRGSDQGPVLPALPSARIRSTVPDSWNTVPLDLGLTALLDPARWTAAAWSAPIDPSPVPAVASVPAVSPAAAVTRNDPGGPPGPDTPIGPDGVTNASAQPTVPALEQPGEGLSNRWNGPPTAPKQATPHAWAAIPVDEVPAEPAGPWRFGSTDPLLPNHPEARPTGVTAADHTPAPTLPPAPPRWLAEDDVERAIADRTALRQALVRRYDAHARVVARTLAQSPGLRAAGGASGYLTAGLVALLAYGDREHCLVNQILRGGGPDSEVDRGMLLARCAAYGLRRLPSVLGPVFRSGPADLRSAAGYRPGEMLIEPAFVDVDLAARPATAEGSLRFVIWSVSAHRLDNLTGDTRPAAIFPPGSRFQVLAIDDEASEQGPLVLLRDLAAVHRNGPDSAERILDRLRAIGQVEARAGETSVPLAFALGLDDGGRPFRATAGAVARENGRT